MTIRIFYTSLRCSRPLRQLHSFPTRRSSDLLAEHRERGEGPRPSRADDRLRLDPPLRGRGRSSRSRSSADRKSTRLNSSHVRISYAVFCLKKKKKLAMTLHDCTTRPHITCLK